MKEYKYKKYDYSFLYNINTVKFSFGRDWVVKSAKIENNRLIIDVISNGVVENFYIDINNLIGYEEKI